MDFQQFITQNRILNLALVMGLCMVSFVLIFVVGPDPEQQPVELPFPPMLLAALAAIPWFGSRLMYRSQMARAAEAPTLSEKLMGYRSAMIVACALAEGFALVALVFYFVLLPESALLFIVAVGAISIFLLQPSESRIINDLGLDSSDVKKLKKTRDIAELV